MKRLVLLVMTVTIFVITGCTPPRPVFNQTYLQRIVPGSPQKRIALPQEISDKASITERTSLFNTSMKYLPVSIYWLDWDRILFNIVTEDNKNSLYSVVVVPSTREIRLLQSAEKNAILAEIEKRSAIGDSESKISSIAKGIVGTLVTFVFRVEPGVKKYYLAKTINNGYALDFDISVKRGGHEFNSVHYDCDYIVKNEMTEKTINGKVRFDENEKKKLTLPEWLKSWRVSPDGRYYMIASTATFVDPDDAYNPFHDLIKNYEYTYAGFDISPRWNEIALLIGKEDEKTKRMNYSIEFYPFSLGNK